MGVIAGSTDPLTVTRAQEGTSASAKNTGGKTYKMVLAPTKKLRDDIETVFGTPFVTISASTPLANERVLTGTTNQITVTDIGAGSAVVLSSPQDIHTTATPTFGGAIINGNIGVTADTALIGLAANAVTVRGSVTASTGGVALDIQNTTDAASNQVAIFRANDRATAAANDQGYLSFYADDNTGTSVEFSRILWEMDDVTSSSKDTTMRFYNQIANTLTDVFSIAGANVSIRGTLSTGVGATGTLSVSNGGLLAKQWADIGFLNGANSAGSGGVALGGSSSSDFRLGVGGVSTVTLDANYSAASAIIRTVWTEASSGTHPLIAGLALTTPDITGGTATVTNTATLYIEGAASATVSGVNYAFWSDAGVNRFDGNTGFGGTANAAYPVDITGNARLTGDLYVDGGDIGTTSDTDLLGLATNTLTVRGEGIFTTDLSVRSKKMQSFVLTVTNTGGTIQHRIGAAGSQGQTPTMAALVANASGTLADTPQSTSAFTNGCALLSAGNEALIFDTPTMDTSIHVGCVSVVYNDTGTDVIPEPNIANRTVNSVAQVRLELLYRNATSGAVFPLNTSNIAAGKQIRVAVFYTL